MNSAHSVNAARPLPHGEVADAQFFTGIASHSRKLILEPLTERFPPGIWSSKSARKLLPFSSDRRKRQLLQSDRERQGTPAALAGLAHVFGLASLGKRVRFMYGSTTGLASSPGFIPRLCRTRVQVDVAGEQMGNLSDVSMFTATRLLKKWQKAQQDSHCVARKLDFN